MLNRRRKRGNIGSMDNLDIVTRYQIGKITDVPPGMVTRMKLFMELADLPMLTWKLFDGTVAQVQRINNEDIIRIWATKALVEQVLCIKIYDSILAKYKYYYFKCLDDGTITSINSIDISFYNNVTISLDIGGYVEYDYANPRFFIGGPFANSLYPNSYDINYYAGVLATEVYGLKVIGKNRTTWGDGIWYDIEGDPWRKTVDYGAMENQPILKENKHQSWVVYGFKMRAGYTKEMILANARSRQHPPFDPSYGEKYWKSLSDDKMFGKMLFDIENLKMQGVHSLNWPPYYEDRTYDPFYIWDGGTSNFAYTENKKFETYDEAVTWAAQWDAIVEHLIDYRWDNGPQQTPYDLFHCSDIIEVDSYPFVEVLFNSTSIPFKQVGIKSPWGILMIYNGILFYGGKDYINANYTSIGTTIPDSSFLNDFFTGKDLTNAVFSFLEKK